MEIKFNSDDSLPLNITLELYNIIMVGRFVYPWGLKILSTNFFRWIFV